MVLPYKSNQQYNFIFIKLSKLNFSWQELLTFTESNTFQKQSFLPTVSTFRELFAASDRNTDNETSDWGEW